MKGERRGSRRRGREGERKREKKKRKKGKEYDEMQMGKDLHGQIILISSLKSDDSPAHWSPSFSMLLGAIWYT